MIISHPLIRESENRSPRKYLWIDYCYELATKVQHETLASLPRQISHLKKRKVSCNFLQIWILQKPTLMLLVWIQHRLGLFDAAPAAYLQDGYYALPFANNTLRNILNSLSLSSYPLITKMKMSIWIWIFLCRASEFCTVVRTVAWGNLVQCLIFPSSYICAHVVEKNNQTMYLVHCLVSLQLLYFDLQNINMLTYF